jgi:hypothetical protein
VSDIQITSTLVTSRVAILADGDIRLNPFSQRATP